jgi:uncharacterized protein (TIGR03792 family)
VCPSKLPLYSGKDLSKSCIGTTELNGPLQGFVSQEKLMGITLEGERSGGEIPLSPNVWSRKDNDCEPGLMVIEWLKFRVPPRQRERYIQLDDEIWTPALRTYPGFIAKETWIDPNEDDVLFLIIRWRTREEWKAIPEADLSAITERFDAALGFEYVMEASLEFQVRRFPTL